MMFGGLVIILLVVLFLKDDNKLFTSRDKGFDTKDAIYILKERYAKGDISDEEYERKIKVLKDNK